MAILRSLTRAQRIAALLLLAAALRLAAIPVVADLRDDYYWEYGDIGNNILAGRGYSFFYFDGDRPVHRFDPSPTIEPVPSAYMPPGYVAFLLPFLAIDDVVLRNVLLLLSQAALSIAALYLLHRLTTLMFSDDVAAIALGLAALMPEMIVAVTSFTPTVLFHLLLLMLFVRYMVRNEENEKEEEKREGREGVKGIRTWRDAIVTGALIGVIVLLRSEFALFLLIVVGAMAARRQPARGAVTLAAALLVIMPWTIRNVIVFGEPVLLSTSGGLNLHRGNNRYAIGSWEDGGLIDRLPDKGARDIELRLDKAFRAQALDHMLNNIGDVIAAMPAKLFYLWAFDPRDERSSHPLHLLTSLPLLLLAIYGIARSVSWRRFHLLYLFLLHTSVVAMLFFPMPRYKTMAMVALIPFAAWGLFGEERGKREKGEREKGRMIGMEKGEREKGKREG